MRAFDSRYGLPTLTFAFRRARIPRTARILAVEERRRDAGALAGRDVVDDVDRNVAASKFAVGLDARLEIAVRRELALERRGAVRQAEAEKGSPSEKVRGAAQILPDRELFPSNEIFATR